MSSTTVETVTDNDCARSDTVPSRNGVTDNDCLGTWTVPSRNGNAARAAAKYRQRRIEWAGSSGIDSFLGPLPQTEEQWAEVLEDHLHGYESLADASFCGACLRDLEPDEPITRGRSMDPVHCADCEPIKNPSPCDACGRPTAYHTLGRRRAWYSESGYGTRTYCCNKCQYSFYRRRKKERSVAKREERRCSVCDNVLANQRGDATYCSAACRQRAYRKRIGAKP